MSSIQNTHTHTSSWILYGCWLPLLCYAMHVAYFMKIVILHAYAKLHTSTTFTPSGASLILDPDLSFSPDNVAWLVSHKISLTHPLCPLTEAIVFRSILFVCLADSMEHVLIVMCVCDCPMSISKLYRAVCINNHIHISYAHRRSGILSSHMKTERHT